METTMQTAQRPKDVNARLRELASTDETFRLTCYLFSLRERSRREVSVNSLYDSLKSTEGWDGEKRQVIQVLEQLASLGIGTLKYSARGRLIGLKNIRVKLQSVGKAAFAESEALVRAFNQPRLQTQAAMPQTIVEEPKKPVIKLRKQVPNPFRTMPTPGSEVQATITIIVDGKSVSIDLPAKILNK